VVYVTRKIGYKTYPVAEICYRGIIRQADKVLAVAVWEAQLYGSNEIWGTIQPGFGFRTKRPVAKTKRPSSRCRREMKAKTRSSFLRSGWPTGLRLPACGVLLIAGYAALADGPDLDVAVSNAIQRADGKLRHIVERLETAHPDDYRYHFMGSNESGKISATRGGWTYGYFPAILWRMYELTPTNDVMSRSFWYEKAVMFSSNVCNVGCQGGTMGDYNNIFQALDSAYRNTGNDIWLDAIMNQARTKDTGNFSDLSNCFGYWRKCGRCGLVHWHAFADHTPDVELMLWAGTANTNVAEGELWINHACSHIETFGTSILNPATLGIAPPYRAGTPQRCFFDEYKDGTGTGEFLHGQCKQGWDHESTWSRGHSWITYGLVAGHRATGHTQHLAYCKTAIDYIIEHLPDHIGDEPRHPRRIPGDHVPLWDYDYTSHDWCHLVLDHWDNEQPLGLVHDSSAGAMAAGAMLRLVQDLPETDPDRLHYWTVAGDILADLTSDEYLSPAGTNGNAALLRKCFYTTSNYTNGYVWGDYYFMDALKTYLALTQTMPPVIAVDASLPDGAVGTAYAQSLSVRGGTSPYVWSIVSNALPAGLVLAETTGSITGTPVAIVHSQFRIRVTDVLGEHSEKTFQMVVRSPSGDSIGDSIADWFRCYYFDTDGLTTNELSCRTADPDGDGADNLQEYRSGTDPTDPVSVFKLLSILAEGSDRRLTWSMPGDRAVVIQATDELRHTFTNLVTNLFVPGCCHVTTNYLIRGASKAQFYRIHLTPAQ